jgi:hypothetical protein
MGLFCAEPHEISLLSVLWYIHSGGGISRLSETSNGAQVRVMSLGVFRAFVLDILSIKFHCKF